MESSLCQEGLLTLFGSRTEKGIEVKVRGELRFERTGPLGSCTAALFIRRYRIGYLPEALARELRLACQLACGSLAPLAVQLLVEGGRHSPDAGGADYRVRIDAIRHFQLG